MGFLVSAFNLFKNIIVAKRKLREGIELTVNYKKIMAKSIATYVAMAFAIIIFIGTVVYSVTYAVKEAWDFLSNKYNTTDINVIYDNLNNMTEEEKLAFQETIAFLDPQKIIKYVDKERTSVPSEIISEKTINEDGNITTENVSVDVSKLSSQYILPWQLVGAMDIITFNANELNNTSVVEASNYAMSQFNWAIDVTRDETNYWKNWEVKTKDDPKLGITVLSDGESTAKEHFKQIKTPLGLAESVNTCFGTYKYDIKRDVVLVNEPYSARQLVKKELTRTERVLDHTKTVTKPDGTEETKKYYRTVSYYTYTYTKTRNTLIEDQMLGPTFTFNPNSFIQFLNSSQYKIDDLPLLKLALEALPSTNNILDMIDRIIEGNYGDLDLSISDGGAIGGINGFGNIPLFHQWDERWGNIPYGDHGTISTSGCGPTSMAMILTGLQANLSGIDLNGDGIADPSEAARYSVANGHRVSEGTSWGFFADIGKKSGLNVRQYSVSQYKQVYEELKKGNPVIASVGPGHFTRAGHFIVLASVLPDGKIKVNDPNKQICSDTPWDFESVIVAEAVQFWAFDNPNRKSSAFVGTAYTGAADEGGGQAADGSMLLGRDLRDKLIAVDKNIIPLGSMVYIEAPPEKRYQTMPDGMVVDMNGYYKAVDTGSAIKGNIIDLYFGTGRGYKELCERWGRENIKVYLK